MVCRSSITAQDRGPSGNKWYEKQQGRRKEDDYPPIHPPMRVHVRSVRVEHRHIGGGER